MDILICVKRVPATGGKITLTPDERQIDTRYASFTISPHEECGVEEALRLVEKHGGTTTVLTLGPPVAADQLRDAMAMGVQRAIHLQTDGREWDPGQTARAIVDTVSAEREAGHSFDLLLFGNEAADSGDYQVGIRVAHALNRPCVTGVKSLEIKGSGAGGHSAVCRREAWGGWEIFEVDLPAVITVREGINLPRYPTVPGRLKSKKAPIETVTPQAGGSALEMVRLKLPPVQGNKGAILGRGPEATASLVDIFRDLGVIAP
ncbi:MAG: electron transfer flavoprotein subunit beta/FixA family protein [Chloroflexota bacterium]